MTIFYLETSALLKRYKSERGSEVVNTLVDGKQGDEVFVTSQLSLYEVQATVVRLVKGGAIKVKDYRQVVGTFLQELSAYGFVVLPLDDRLVWEAMDLLPRYPLRTADALQLTSALRAKRVVGDEAFYVVSADRDIGEACFGNRLEVLNPEMLGALEHLQSIRRR